MKLKSFFLSNMLLFLGIFVYAQAPENTINPQEAPQDSSPLRGYTLGPGDQIAGNVFGEQGYDFVINVDEDGMIAMPFMKQPIVAQCKTERELKLEIEMEIRKYLRDPHLNFRVSEKHSRPPVSVYGEINKVAEITLTRERTLIEILAIAGGAKEQEASGLVEVRRPRTPLCMADSDKDNWKTSPSRTFRLADINAGREDSNPVIYPGDMILVQRAPPVYITGEVVAPQGGVFLKERGLSLTEGIGLVGGPRPEADKKNISIYRLKPGSNPESKDRELISANLKLIREGKQKDIMLQPYDLIVVDKAKKSIGVIIAEMALNAAKTGTTAFTNVLPYRIVY